MRYILSLIGLILLAIAINLPLGYLRQKCRKFSLAWYFYVHISIPVIIYLRVKSGLGWQFIPFTLTSAVIGQILGGRLLQPVDDAVERAPGDREDHEGSGHPRRICRMAAGPDVER